MEDKLQRTLFTAHLNETFRVRMDEETIFEMTLIEVQPLKAAIPPRNPWDSGPVPKIRQDPFSLIFRGPREHPLQQRLYVLEHEEMGEIEGLFLVPVGMNEEGLYYEAVVN